MTISVSFDQRLAAIVAAAVMGSAAFAGVVPVVTVTADENGNGTIAGVPVGPSMPGVMTADTSFGGLPSALFYDLLGPPPLVLGDLLISEIPGGPISDVIRFTTNTAGRYGFFFYSDIDGGADAIADVGLPITPVPGNVFFGVEITLPDGSSGFIYHPGPNDPGYAPGFDVTYTFVSDLIPAPGAAAIVGLGGLLAARRRR